MVAASLAMDQGVCQVTYNVQSRAFTISEKDLHSAALMGMYAIQRMRVMAGLPTGKRDHDGPLQEIDHAEKAVIDCLKSIGIDLGVSWGYELDVTRIG